MSQRPNAPYLDAMDGDGNILYEGHDANRTAETPEPKQLDQPRYLPSGKATQNGRFADWTDEHLEGRVAAATFHVYEKLRDGIWTFRGLFALRGYQYVPVQNRSVFRFLLAPIDAPEKTGKRERPTQHDDTAMTRRIPTWVKQAVYKRDKGQCVECGSRTELHFDHDFPYSKGGSGMTPANVRILCARHNLSKGARIQ